MPVRPCGQGKWRIGNGPCVYDSESKAQTAYRAYLWRKSQEKKGKRK